MSETSMRCMFFTTVVASLCTTLLTADDKISRVYDPPRLPADVRLDKPRDYNKTTGWTPPATVEAWEARKKELREQLQVSLGLWPMPEKTPLSAVVHGKIDREDYTVEKVYFQSLPGHYVTGNLYRPKKASGKLPGVLCPHGHWRNGRFYEANEKEVKRERDSGAEDTDESARYPLQARCVGLARMGCVVFHYDMVGNADSFQLEHRHEFHKGMAAETTLWLHNNMGLQTWNSIRALDFLCGLADVDGNRIGVTGASGGGTQTFILCALDDRPAVAFPAVMVGMNMQGGCTCENAPLLRIGTNNVEIAAMFAPKPMGLSGANDWTKDIETVGLPELKKIYGFYRAADKVAAKHFSFPHNYNQRAREMMYDWFNLHLRLGQAGAVKERPFKPIDPKDLSVWTGNHARPKDATMGREHAMALQEYLRKGTQAQLESLATKQPDAYKALLRTALRHMVQDKLPEKVVPVAGTFQSVKQEKFTVHKAGLTRPGSDTELPTIGLIPNDWNGSVVIWLHKDGKAGLFDKDGKPTPAIQKLLDAKQAVMSGDLFLTGEFHLVEKRGVFPKVNAEFPGYTLGYNRSLLANQVHDVLTLIANAKQVKQAKGKISVVAEPHMAVPALLASALADGTIDRVAVDLRLVELVDALELDRLLPGYSKYGGALGFASLYPQGTTLHLAKEVTVPDRVRALKNIELRGEAPKPELLAEAVLK